MGDDKDVGQTGDVQVKAAENADVEAVEIEADQEQSVGKMTDSDIMAALNNKLGNLLNSPAFTLPKPVKRLVKALKKIQVKHVDIEVEFFKELHDLEMKYEKLFEPLYEKRCEIVNGTVYPTDEECDYQSDSEKENELSNEVQKVKLEDEEMKEPEIDIKGIPEFWLTAIKNAPSVADMIEEYDEPILKHLIDIKAVTVREPMSFYIEFHFEPNDFFTNTVLTKTYELRLSPDPSDVFSFEGPEIVKSKGCTIDWKKGKNVTVKTIKKKQKHKARGAVRTVTKTVQNDSFFNFFNPPAVPEDEEQELDEETQNVLNNDFEVGNLFKDRIIPHAVLFFTGENMIDDEFDEEDEDEDEEDYEDEEDEDDDDDDENDKGLNRKKSQGKQTNQQQPPECKQQ